MCLGTARTQDYVAYYNLVNEAEYQSYLGKSDLAFGLYNKAFSLRKIQPKARDLYLFAKIYLENLDRKNALKYLKQIPQKPDGALLFWMTTERYFFARNLKPDELNGFMADVEHREMERNKSISRWNDSLNVYLHEDQRLRRVFTDSIQVYFREGQKPYDDFWTKVQENDYQNQIRFLAFIKKYGYPGLYMTGSDMAGTILRHIHCKLYPEYRQTLHKLLLAGQVEPFHYASMVDRVGCICEGKSMYGDAEGCALDWQTVLQNRQSIGLSIYFNGTGTHPIRTRSLLQPR